MCREEKEAKRKSKRERREEYMRSRVGNSSWNQCGSEAPILQYTCGSLHTFEISENSWLLSLFFLSFLFSLPLLSFFLLFFRFSFQFQTFLLLALALGQTISKILSTLFVVKLRESFPVRRAPKVLVVPQLVTVSSAGSRGESPSAHAAQLPFSARCLCQATQST